MVPTSTHICDLYSRGLRNPSLKTLLSVHIQGWCRMSTSFQKLLTAKMRKRHTLKLNRNLLARSRHGNRKLGSHQATLPDPSFLVSSLSPHFYPDLRLHQHIMVKETPPSHNEKAFVLEALQQGLRVDGRGPHDIRAVKIALGPQYGHAEIRLGKTRSVMLPRMSTGSWI